ncbi:MAG: hypothetical protein V4667_08550 [Bacteroidota bacterium]
MKKLNLLYLVVLSALISLTATSDLFAQCKEKKAITKTCKPQMKPFHYDGMAYNDIQFDEKPKVIDVEFTAFAGEKYKLLFCKSNFKENVVIKIYDKNKRNKNRKIVYDSSTVETNIWGFEPPRSGNYFIEYEVPVSSTGVKKNECMVLLIGYK